jgi:hypothetical protein
MSVIRSKLRSWFAAVEYPNEIRDAFKTYFEGAEIGEAIDPGSGCLMAIARRFEWNSRRNGQPLTPVCRSYQQQYAAVP